jgi:uncharacterized protein (TIGR01777 family)
MKFLITGGTGFIGKRLVRRLTQDDHQVTILTRSEKKSKDRLISYRKWNGKEMPVAIGLYDVVINLAGASIAESRWTPAYKKLIRDSRVDATRACVEYINSCQTPPKAFLSGSAIGYYGGNNPDPVDESAPAGTDFMGSICQDWEEASKGAKCRTLNLRISMVLGEGGGPLDTLIPIYKLGLGGTMAGGKQGISWIHLDDLVAAILFLVENEKMEGPVNLAAPEYTDQKQFSDTLADVLSRPAFWIVPKFALDIILGEKSIIVAGGQKVIPARLKEAGFNFRFPDLEEAFQDIAD